MITDREWDPPGPRWLSWYIEQCLVLTLITYVVDLAMERWTNAIETLGWVLVNACNAYFNRLPLSRRLEVMRGLLFWRRGEDS